MRKAAFSKSTYRISIDLEKATPPGNGVWVKQRRSAMTVARSSRTNSGHESEGTVGFSRGENPVSGFDIFCFNTVKVKRWYPFYVPQGCSGDDDGDDKENDEEPTLSH